MQNTQWTLHRFYHDGDAYFAELMRMFREAKTEIRLETYIFEMDPLTKMLLEELRIARERGCRVRLLVDGFGSYYWLQTLADYCRSTGIELRVWEPLPRSFLTLQILIRNVGFRIFRQLRNFNRRNHRKLALIDEKKVFIGSMNWTQVHSEKLFGLNSRRDSAVLLEGPGVLDVSRAMEKAWRHSRKYSYRKFLPGGLKDPLYDPRTSKVRLNQSLKDRRFLTRDLLRRLKTAREHILIETAYFLPTRGLLVALRKAAKRGVKVEILIQGRSDAPIVKWAASGISRVLIKAGVHVFEYQPRILHAKFLIIDQWAALGSMNLNHRSLFHDLEVEAVFDEPETVSELTRQWMIDRGHSKILSLQSFRTPWGWRRFLQSVAFRLRYLL